MVNGWYSVQDKWQIYILASHSPTKLEQGAFYLWKGTPRPSWGFRALGPVVRGFKLAVFVNRFSVNDACFCVEPHADLIISLRAGDWTFQLQMKAAGLVNSTSPVILAEGIKKHLSFISLDFFYFYWNKQGTEIENLSVPITALVPYSIKLQCQKCGSGGRKSSWVTKLVPHWQTKLLQFPHPLPTSPS